MVSETTKTARAAPSHATQTGVWPSASATAAVNEAVAEYPVRIQAARVEIDRPITMARTPQRRVECGTGGALGAGFEAASGDDEGGLLPRPRGRCEVQSFASGSAAGGTACASPSRRPG